MSTATTTLPRARGGVLGLIASTDHKSVAIRIFLTGFFFFVAGGILALLIRTELTRRACSSSTRTTTTRSSRCTARR